MKNVKVLFAALLLVAVAASCSKEEMATPALSVNDQAQNSSAMQNAPSAPCYAKEVTSVEYDILSVLLSGQPGYPAQTSVVAQKSLFSNGIQPTDELINKKLVAKYPSIDKSIFVSFNARNQSQVLFGNYFHPQFATVKVLTQAEEDYYFNNPEMKDGWKAFQEKYGQYNGISRFSRVGVNAAKTQAIVELFWDGGPMRISGALIYLVKENNKWVEKETVMTIIS